MNLTHKESADLRDLHEKHTKIQRESAEAAMVFVDAMRNSIKAQTELEQVMSSKKKLIERIAKNRGKTLEEVSKIDLEEVEFSGE